MSNVELHGEGLALFDWLKNPKEAPAECILEGVTKGGKTRLAAEWVKHVCNTYPDSKGLVLRKTKVSLVDAFQDVFENQVLGHNHPALQVGGKGENRRRYKHESLGGEVVLGGMDHPTRLFSTNYDWIYVNEAQELTLEEWESLIRAKFGRVSSFPYKILFGDCNPEGEFHWINQRCEQKVGGKPRMHRLVSRFYDNPMLYDYEKKEWTEKGSEFLIDARRTFTAHRLQRLFYGKWVAAEGLVWDNWSAEDQHITADLVKNDDGHYLFVKSWADDEGSPKAVRLVSFVGVQDCGYSAPGVAQVWGFDSADRAYLVAEVYKTKKHNQWWIEKVWVPFAEEFPIEAILTDHDPSFRDSLNLEMRRKGNDGLPMARYADKSPRGSKGQKEKAGIGEARIRFAPRADGTRGLYIVRDTLRFGKDPALVEKSLPTCTAEEIPGYCYPTYESGKPVLDEPVKKDDHGCFVADTLILTPTGEACIQDLRVGDLVLTPNGQERITDAQITGRNVPVVKVTHSSGEFTCTPDHPIWVEGRGVIPADELRYGMVLACAKSASSTRAFDGIDIPIAPIGGIGTTEAGWAESAFACIDTFGSRLMGRFRRVFTFITSTETEPTTPSEIYTWSVHPSTEGFTASIHTVSCPSEPVSVRPQERCPTQGPAQAAGRRFDQCVSRIASALRLARCALLGKKGDTTKSGSAGSVRAFSRSTVTPPSDHALSLVLAKEDAGRADVFNLTVAPSHVYYANGVLASNCDCIRYVASWKRDREKLPEGDREVQSWGVKSYGTLLGHAEVLGQSGSRVYRNRQWQQGRLVETNNTPGFAWQKSRYKR